MHDQGLTQAIPLLMNAVSVHISPLQLALATKLLVFLCSAFPVTQRSLYICSLIYLSTESNHEMVLFNKTFNSVILPRWNVYNFFSFHLYVTKICKWSFFKCLRGPHLVDTYLLRRMMWNNVNHLEAINRNAWKSICKSLWLTVYNLWNIGNTVFH